MLCLAPWPPCAALYLDPWKFQVAALPTAAQPHLMEHETPGLAALGTSAPLSSPSSPLPSILLEGLTAILTARNLHCYTPWPLAVQPAMFTNHGGLNGVPLQAYVHILTPQTCDCDLFGKRDLCSYN